MPFSETEGENREFLVASASDVTVFFNGGPDSDKTSADDTATEKYTDNYGSRKIYQIRNTEAIQVISINGVTFTEPITVVKDKGIIEKLDTPLITKMFAFTLCSVSLRPKK